MHVVIDGRLARSSGHRTYLRNVVPRLARLVPDWRFTIAGGAEVADDPVWGALPNLTTALSRSPVYGLAEQVEPVLRWPRPDLYWVPHYNIPVLHPGPLVVTVHDMAHLRLDEYAGRSLRLWYARAMHRAARRRAAALVFISEFTRREFTDLVGAPLCPSSVVPEGVDASWFDAAPAAPAAPAAGDGYYVYVGNFKPHKNLALLFEAWALLRDQLRARLVVIGREGILTADQSIRARAAELGDAGRVEVVGHCDDDALRRWVAGARAMIFPSLYEGFGLPPLEAMAAGCAVIASSAASIPEVCGDAALYFDPRDARALADRILEVDRSPALRDALRERGAMRARQFSWDNTAQGTLAVLRSALTRGSARR